jgi:hypothetical protein
VAGTSVWLAILILSAPVSAPAQDWAERFPPAPECQPRLRLSKIADSALQSAGRGRVVVLPHVMGDTGRVQYAKAELTPAAKPVPSGSWSIETEDSAQVRVLESDTIGRHLLSLRGIGYGRFLDTVDVRAGHADTLDVWLRRAHDEYRNTFNCRPRGFRRTGESACVVDSVEVEPVLARAKTFAGAGSLKAFGIQPFDSSRVELVRNEKTCTLAGKLYGDAADPPRRVVVVRMGPLYMVYDPYEPVAAGEWDIWRIFDRRWRPVFDLMN